MNDIDKNNYGACKFDELTSQGKDKTKKDHIVVKELNKLNVKLKSGLINIDEWNDDLDLLESKHNIQIVRAMKSQFTDDVTTSGSLGGINLTAKYHLGYRYDGDKESQLTYDFLGTDLIRGSLFWNKIVESNPELTHRQLKQQVLGLIEYMSCKTLKKPIRPDIPKELKVIYKKSLKGDQKAKEMVELSLAGYLGFFAEQMLQRETTTLVVNDYPATSERANKTADAISKMKLEDLQKNDANMKELNMTQELMEKQMLRCGTVTLTFGDEDVDDLQQEDVGTKHDFIHNGRQLKEDTETLGSA